MIQELGYLTLVLVLFGMDFISISYLCGFLFTDSNRAYKIYPIISYIIFAIFPWIIIAIFREKNGPLKFFDLLFTLTDPFYNMNKG